MSKKVSPSKNTLFKYFARSPTTPKLDKSSQNHVASPLASKSAHNTPTTTKSNGKPVSVYSNSILTENTQFIRNRRKFHFHRNYPNDFFNKYQTFVGSKSKGSSIKLKKQKLDMDIDDGDSIKLKKQKLDMSSASDDEDVKPMTSKRKFSRIIDTDSESDRENESNNKMQVDDDDEIVVRKRSASGESTSNKKIKLDPDDTKAATSFEAKLKANIEKTKTLSDVKEIIDVPTVYKHQNLEFLKPQNLRDANKRKTNDPNYDPTTLYVPKEFLDSLTPVNFDFSLQYKNK